jgi:PAS domain S-box-containing protein
VKRTTVSERALVLAPRGRDAAIAVAILGEAGISAALCPSLPDLVLELDRGAAVVVVTEEALATADLGPLAAWIADQEEWSDLPFVLLTSHGGGLERNPAARRYLDVLGNATFVERPFHPTTLISSVRSALRGRRRQYQARSRLEALREGEARLRLATENAEVGFWDVDPINDVLIWPGRVKAMFGISPDVPVTMQTFYEGLHPDDCETTAAAYAAATDPQRRALYDVEYRTIGKEDGVVRWVAAKGRGLFDEAGRCFRVVGTAIDVTPRKAAEAALRESEARLSFLDRLGAETAPLSDADAVLATTTRLLGEHLNLSVCAYADMDEDQDGFTIRGDWAAPGSKSIVGHYSLADFGKLAVKNLSSGLPLVVNDNLRELAPEEAATFQSIGIAATICMPLVKEGRLTALMAIHDRVPRVWTEAELGLLREITARSWAHVERVAATAELRASEARFRLTADAVPQIVWITDAEGRVEFFNKQWSDYTGVECEPTTAAEVAANHVHPDDAAATVVAFDEARRTGNTYLVEHRIRSKANEYRWFLVRGEPYRNPQTGEIIRWFGASVDIHDRKIAEAALRESEEFNRRILQSSADCIKVLDLDGHLEFMSEGGMWVMEVDGFGAIEGACWPDFWPDEVRGKVLTAIEEAKGGGTGRLQGFATTAKGSPRWWDVVVTSINDPNGKPDKLLSVSRDVTATREAEERLRELNETLEAQVAERTAETRRYRDIVEATAAPICAFDTDFRLIAFNKAHNDEFRRVNGFDTKVGDVFPDLFIPEQRAVMRALMGRALSGESFTVVEEFGRPELGTPWWEISYTPLRDEAGRIVGAFHQAKDISARLVAEAELEAAQEALRQSQKMEAMGSLTGGVAHDFNNLLTPIVGALDMLQRKGLGGEREQRLIGGAAQSAERAKVLVQRLLAFARRQPLQPVAVDVTKLVENMADLVSSTTGPQIKVVVDAQDSLPPAKADPNQLEMALLNLAVNARDAMPDGGTLRISASADTVRAESVPKLRPGRYVRLSVADTGIGMDEATLARAVEPFFSTKGVGKGTGLGLSMVHGLASQLGGALTIKSKSGLGTNIELWLPQTEAAPEEPTAIHEVEPARGRGTALLVDDEEFVRLSTADMLGDLGYHVVEAASAEEALRVIGNGARVDLVVTDHLMPGISGTDLARTIRDRRPDLPVLVVSGYAEVDGIASDLPRLTKPFRKDELAAGLAALTPSRTA